MGKATKSLKALGFNKTRDIDRKQRDLSSIAF